jgi:hypothetical protein
MQYDYTTVDGNRTSCCQSTPIHRLDIDPDCWVCSCGAVVTNQETL